MASGMIALTCGMRASLSSCLPVNSADTPCTVTSRRFSPAALPGSASLAERIDATTPWLEPSTITLNTPVGRFSAFAKSDAGTNADRIERAPAGEAEPATTAVAATTAASVASSQRVVPDDWFRCASRKIFSIQSRRKEHAAR
jgi:hypothetical protein